MGLQKNVVSERTGMTLGYHEVFQVSFNQSNANIVVASYPDKAAKDTGKQFSDVSNIQVPYGGETIGKGALAWAQDQVKATDKFSGATEV